jgi:hypothetical protein
MKPTNTDESLTRSSYFNTWNGAVVTDRDGGLFDSLTPLFNWNNRPNAKKLIYENLRLKGSSYPSPYHGILDALEKHADLVVTGLLIEIADQPSRFSLSLGNYVDMYKLDIYC